MTTPTPPEDEPEVDDGEGENRTNIDELLWWGEPRPTLELPDPAPFTPISIPLPTTRESPEGET